MLVIGLIIALIHLSKCGDLCDHHVFNWNFYLNHNKDLLRSGHRDSAAACSHWKSKGANEGRQAHPKFHSMQYCEIYEDIRKAGLCKGGHYANAINHYLDNGIKEGREGYHKQGGHGMWVVSNGLLTLTASANHAGAISSILYNDRVELVNSFDRGREFQYAFSDSTGECHNPTEAGSGTDGISDHTTSVLHGIKVVPGQYIATTCQPAYWKGPEDPCTKGRGKLSPFRIAKQVTLNVGGNKHLLSFDTSFTMPYDFDMLAFEFPTLYMPATFDRVYEIDLGSRSYHQVPLPADWKSIGTTKPIMYVNHEGVAVGVRLKGMKGPAGTFRYVYFGKMASNAPIDHTTKWSLWYGSGGVKPAGTQIAGSAYIAIGSPQEVVDALRTP